MRLSGLFRTVVSHDPIKELSTLKAFRDFCE
jgi:hypothetical protein